MFGWLKRRWAAKVERDREALFVRALLEGGVRSKPLVFAEPPPMPDVSDAPQFRLRAAAAAPFGSFKFQGYEGRVHRPLMVSLTDERGQVQTFELRLSAEYQNGELRLVPDLAALDAAVDAAVAAGAFGWTA